MSAIKTNSLSIREAPDIFPDDLVIPEGWPSMDFAFIDKLLRGSASWGYEKWLACHTVIVSYLFVSRFFQRREPSSEKSESRTTKLSEITIVTADKVSCYKTAPISQVFLNWFVAGSMLFL